MQVVILCGGQGTRLREETEFKPKPMVMIGDKPIIWHIMKHYVAYGFRDFILCLGYKGQMIKEYFKEFDTDWLDWNIRCVDTGDSANTGCRVKRIEDYVGGKTFMLTYGDGLSSIRLIRLLEFHKKNKGIGTLSAVYPDMRFGAIKIGDKKRVTQFVEKPKMSTPVNGGFYVFEPAFFDYLQDNESCVMEKEPLNKLSADKQLFAFKHKGFWHCMDTYKDYLDLNEMWKTNNAYWKIW